MTAVTTKKGKKYALVEQEAYKALKNANRRTELTESPEFAKVKSLDEKIEDVLSNKNLPDAKKAQLYAEALGSFMEVKSRAPETTARSNQDRA